MFTHKKQFRQSQQPGVCIQLAPTCTCQCANKCMHANAGEFTNTHVTMGVGQDKCGAHRHKHKASLQRNRSIVNMHMCHRAPATVASPIGRGKRETWSSTDTNHTVCGREWGAREAWMSKTVSHVEITAPNLKPAM